VEAHSLVEVSLQKGVSRNATLSQSPQQNNYLACLKQQVAKEIFWTPWFSEDG